MVVNVQRKGEAVSSFKASRHTQKSLPAYSHMPGVTPHPTRSPQGHCYVEDRSSEAQLPNLNAANPLACESFLFGIDLFNAHYWWECHEAMEGLWHVAGRGSPAGHTLQAVIQCAAAHLKVLQGNFHGALLLFTHAEQHVSWAEGWDLGLDLIGMLAETGAYVTGDTKDSAVLLLKSDHQSHHGQDLD